MENTLYTTDEFAEKIKAKYPQYGDLDNATLTEKIITKHPVYKNQLKDYYRSGVAETQGGSKVDITSNLSESWKRLKEGITSPVESLSQDKGYKGIGSGIVRRRDTLKENFTPAYEQLKETGRDFSGLADSIQKGNINEVPSRAIETIGSGVGTVFGGIGGAINTLSDATIGKNLGSITTKPILNTIGSTIMGIAQTGGAAALKGIGLALDMDDDEMNRNLPDPEKLANILSIFVPAKAGKMDSAKLVETIKSLPLPTKEKIKAQFKTPETSESLVGKIIQGETKDVPAGLNVLKDIAVEKGETYKSLADKLTKLEEEVSTAHDRALETNQVAKKLDDFTTKVKTGASKESGLPEVIESNPVNEALNQLLNFYDKTNDVQGKLRTLKRIDDAKIEGLNAKQVNEIAKEHGQKLNAYNASGELASGLSRQSAENTRSALKDITREMFGNPLSQKADLYFSNLRKTKELVLDMQEKVFKELNKIKQRSNAGKFGVAIANLVETIANSLSMGLLRTVMRKAATNSDQVKLNYQQLEKMLFLNMKKLQELTNSGKPEAEIIKDLTDYANKMQTKLLPPATGEVRSQTFGSKPIILPENVKESTSGLSEVKNAKVNRSDSEGSKSIEKVSQETQENKYIPDSELPVIKMGNKPKQPKSDLPVIDISTGLKKGMKSEMEMKYPEASKIVKDVITTKQKTTLEYDDLPLKIKKIVDTFDENKDAYKEADRIIRELKRNGYTADYGLDGVLHSFERLPKNGT